MAMKSSSGRRPKRENTVWSNFNYDAITNKSACIVGGVGVNDGKFCGRLITGKTPQIY
jgi:hypothetical protein